MRKPLLASFSGAILTLVPLILAGTVLYNQTNSPLLNVVYVIFEGPGAWIANACCSIHSPGFALSLLIVNWCFWSTISLFVVSYASAKRRAKRG